MNRILRPARYNNDNDDRTFKKMRDRSTRTEATTSSDDATDTSSSSSLSHDPISHPEDFWNESDSCCGVDSVVSHVRSVQNDGHTLNDEGDDDDDMSFAPLDDDDDDDDNDGKSSFPQYDDDENDDNNFIETNVPNKYSQDCPFDEEQDRNENHVVSQSPHTTKPYEANSPTEHSPLNNSPSNDQFILQQKTLPVLTTVIRSYASHFWNIILVHRWPVGYWTNPGVCYDRVVSFTSLIRVDVPSINIPQCANG